MGSISMEKSNCERNLYKFQNNKLPNLFKLFTLENFKNIILTK